VLRRAFRLTTAEAAANLYFRAATGSKIIAADGGFVVDERLHFRFNGPNGVEPIIRSVENGAELLLPIRFNNGDNSSTAQFELEMLW
jgi:hypothetical protein